MLTLDETIAYIKEKHRGQTDKAGQPYWKHPVRVMERCRSLVDAGLCRPSALWACLLHDVLEDTATDEAEVERLFGAEVLACVRLDTRPGGMDYRDYVERLLASGSREAACVKWCDLQDNSDPARLKALPAETAQRLEAKYAPLKALYQEKAPRLFA
ncbi:MAG: bifunctional (p)ppGpp synthetase/guanosine-3',5'-bis(diphosphate) 3'-pyrophosphohydrolase [Desulfovibrio sp.]|nr:bifunctional (p)ppGpp synthetase/guanosine-3',5'-bis(diphosphate) 3'-pyrophosphohydrolase [Desulfovibrio sp.]